mmetsp:Transcript_26994/g.37966  ORF Transcript_26994/g.37966 Transcript_26994/m.37966 type:complete len:207 (-) Transcript_26994:1154-1774(-)
MSKFMRQNGRLKDGRFVSGGYPVRPTIGTGGSYPGASSGIGRFVSRKEMGRHNIVVNVEFLQSCVSHVGGKAAQIGRLARPLRTVGTAKVPAIVGGKGRTGSSFAIVGSIDPAQDQFDAHFAFKKIRGECHDLLNPNGGCGIPFKTQLTKFGIVNDMNVELSETGTFIRITIPRYTVAIGSVILFLLLLLFSVDGMRGIGGNLCRS